MRPITINNPEELKAVVLTVLQEHPEIIRSAIVEILLGEATEVQESPAARRERLRALILEDFNRYDEVFKKLALE